MKIKNIVLVFTVLLSSLSYAQVKDISFTLSPAGEYTWWDNKAGIEDGSLIGGKLGFGFGEYLELRAVYMQSLDLKTSFDDYGFANFNPDLYDPQNITLKRWGGEFKANIGTKKLMPYITLGTGVQTIATDFTDDLEQIYASAGLGVKFNLNRRIVFSLEGKNTTFNFNSGSNLLTDADRSNLGISETDISNERLSNWSVLGSLQFYLGGRTPGTLTELDQAYLNKFKGGFKGLQLVLEPGGNYIAFDNNSLYRDTYMLGGYAGLNFNEYVGLHAFYFLATKEEEISIDFDNLNMYGLEFRARLNDGNGVTPYLILGGGFINPYPDYLGKEGLSVDGKEFATGGLGLEIPLGKHFLISGGIKTMITSGLDVTDVNAPDDIQSHVMYNAGLQFTLGKKAVEAKEVYKQTLNRELTGQREENDQKIKLLKEEYESKMVSLEVELKKAYETKNVDKAIKILEEKKEVEKSLEEVEILEKVNENKATDEAVVNKDNIETKEINNSEFIQLTPAQFESLLVRILQETNDLPVTESLKETQIPQSNEEQQIELLNQRIDLLEKVLMEIDANKTDKILKKAVETKPQESDETSLLILQKLDDLNKKIEAVSNRVESQENEYKAVVIPPQNEEKAVIKTLDKEEDIFENQELSDKERKLQFQSVAATVGYNFADETSANFGIRLYYNIKKTPFQFMPKAYIGLGENTSYGLSGNVIYPFMKNHDKVSPYIGAGLGIENSANNTFGNYNIIIGLGLPVIHKNVFIDYTMKNNFDYNEFVVGYKISF